MTQIYCVTLFFIGLYSIIIPTRSEWALAKGTENLPGHVKRIANQILQGTKSIARVRIPGGVIGKLTTVIVFYVVALAVMVCAVRDASVAKAAIWVSTGVVVVMSPLMIWFAHKNPQAAILEGSEFIIHQELNRVGTKNTPEIIDDPALRTDPQGNLPLAEPTSLKLLDQESERDKGDDV